MWRAFLAWLASLTADPVAIDREAPRAAGAVAAAYASFVQDAAPTPGPTPRPGDCCRACGGTGSITHGDGHKTPCPCPSSCKCKQKTKTACPDGGCPQSKTVLR